MRLQRYTFPLIPANLFSSQGLRQVTHCPLPSSPDNDFTYYAYANDIAWNLALAYIKDDQINKAIPILQKKQTDNPDVPIFQKAQELLKKIREL